VLLGQHLVDVRGEERVGGQDGLADRALDRGLELLFGGAVEALEGRGVSLGSCSSGGDYWCCSRARHEGGIDDVERGELTLF
jgi:hypothetical protein